MTRLEELYDLLREAKVYSGEFFEDFAHGGDYPEAFVTAAHPLYALWAHQDSEGREDGLTVSCACGEDIWCWYCEVDVDDPDGVLPDHSERCRCHGTGRVLRNTSYWPESAVKGWVWGMLLLAPPHPPVGTYDSLETHIDALIAAAREVLEVAE